MSHASVLQYPKCYHCGDDCREEPVYTLEKTFCCEGCKTVYELLHDNGMCTYYDLDKNAGLKIEAPQQHRFAYLDNTEIVQQLLDFEDNETARIRLKLPGIHCSSCIWLLENLHKLREGITYSRVDFIKKELSVVYSKDKISLRSIAELLDTLGYAPDISLADYSSKQAKKKDRSLSYKIGIAGFCSANIMMLSFPEYLGIDQQADFTLYALFGYINLLLAIPVVAYSASDYFISAFSGLRHKVLNLDIPIALGIAAIFLRSTYEIVSHTGAGYFDSLTGLIFFLLIGKWFQHKTFSGFSFERDYLSYFPVAVTKVSGEKEESIPLSKLACGDTILIRNNELIPADAQLMAGTACIDYSFVTGESLPVNKQKGELIYAGGRQTGNAIRLKVQKEVSQSYLLQLWNKEVFRKEDNAYLSSFILTFSKYFTIGTLIIAVITTAYWYFADPSKLLFSVTAVLLVACPCAIALSLPFALSNCLRLLGRKGLYLKSADTVEKLSGIDTIVFDKTGTLTEARQAEVHYTGKELSQAELRMIKSTLRQSSHPYSRAVYAHINADSLPVNHFEEIAGAGISCIVAGHTIRLGSVAFAGYKRLLAPESESRVYVSIDEEFKGYYAIQNQYRPFINNLLTKLGHKYELHLLSGDNANEKERLSPFFNNGNNLCFQQQPTDKLQYIETLQAKGKKVLMIGDGLNDAGALKAADVGISISDDTYHFSPACDGILEGKQIGRLMSFLQFSKAGVNAIKLSLILSLCYNAIGLYFAVQGKLSPLIAAIIMPTSSVTVVLFVILVTGIAGKKWLRSEQYSVSLRS